MPKYQLPRDTCAPTDRYKLLNTEPQIYFQKEAESDPTVALPAQREDMDHSWDLPPFCPALEL